LFAETLNAAVAASAQVIVVAADMVSAVKAAAKKVKNFFMFEEFL
jgi:hypothetical protein